MTRPTRFGVLSFAHYHANFWAAAMNESKEATLVGVWDDDRTRGEEAAQTYNTRFWPSLQELLAACDAVGITSETSKHADLVDAAAAAGCHVLLEKPMAANLQECRRIRAAIRDAGVTFMQNFPKRFDPINHQLVELVQRGDLGAISMVRVRHGNAHLLELGSAASEAWYARPELSGGGALIDEGIHAADFLIWLLGLPQHAVASTSNATLGLPAEDAAMALYTYASGTLAEIVSSNAFVAAEESIEIYGSKGTAILSGVDLASRDFSQAPYLKLFDGQQEAGQWQASDTVPYFKHGKQDFHKQGPLYFLDCVRHDKPPRIGLEEAWKSQAMVEAAYEAARSGRRQAVVRSLDAE